MPNTGDVYYVLSEGQILGETWQVTAWYEITTPGSALTVSDDLVDYWIDTIFTRHAPVASDEWSLDMVTAYLWRNPGGDYFSNTSSIVGAVSASPAAPPFISVKFRSPKPYPGKRYSFHGFPGVTQAEIGDGVLATTSNWDDIASYLGTSLTVEGSTIATPCQIMQASKGSPGGGTNPDVNRLLNGTWTYKLGTNNSRKFGRGI